MKICLLCKREFEAKDWICPYCGKSPDIKNGFISFISKNNKAHESFDASAYLNLYNFEKNHFWFRHRFNIIFHMMKEYFLSVQEVLEIGCGTGFALSEIHKMFPGHKIYGSDLFSEGLHFAQERVVEGSFFQMDACDMPFVEEFDLVLALDIIEHIGNDDEALRNIHRSIKRGGGIIVTVPQHSWLWSIQDVKSFHKRRYSKKNLISKMKDAGFTILKNTSFISLLLPFMVLSRTMSRLEGNEDNYDPSRELRITPFLNKILEKVCLMEELLIKRGLTFPAGGSLMVVGKKNL